jgi:hypothetical protein
MGRVMGRARLARPRPCWDVRRTPSGAGSHGWSRTAWPP